MLTTHPKMQSAQVFEDIYQAAKSGDMQKLTSMVEDGACIDVSIFSDKGLRTPASLLASEGNHQAVELLKKLGANKDWIAQGYASGGYEKYADNYFKVYDANPDLIAYGFAIAGKEKMVDKYENEFFADKNLIVTGYTIAKNSPKVAFYIANKNIKLEAVAEGYVTIGDNEKIEELLKDNKINISSLAKFYAFYGNVEGVEKCKKSLQADAEGHAQLINMIAQGYAQGGHFSEAKECIEKLGADVGVVCIGLAVAGHFSELATYKEDQKFNRDVIARALAFKGFEAEARKYNPSSMGYIASGFAMSGNIKKLETYILENKLNLKLLADELWRSGIFKLDENTSLKLLSSLKNSDFIVSLAKELNNFSLPDFSMTQVAKHAVHLKKLMDKFDINFAQAIAWSKPEVQTWFMQGMPLVRDGKLAYDNFIQVLNELSPLTYNESKDLYNKAYTSEYLNVLINRVQNSSKFIETKLAEAKPTAKAFKEKPVEEKIAQENEKTSAPKIPEGDKSKKSFLQTMNNKVKQRAKDFMEKINPEQRSSRRLK